jgi:hypothetical protein
LMKMGRLNKTILFNFLINVIVLFVFALLYYRDQS